MLNDDLHQMNFSNNFLLLESNLTSLLHQNDIINDGQSIDIVQNSSILLNDEICMSHQIDHTNMKHQQNYKINNQYDMKHGLNELNDDLINTPILYSTSHNSLISNNDVNNKKQVEQSLMNFCTFSNFDTFITDDRDNNNFMQESNQKSFFTDTINKNIDLDKIQFNSKNIKNIDLNLQDSIKLPSISYLSGNSMQVNNNYTADTNSSHSSNDSKVQKRTNKSKFKRYEKIKCSICGDHSSGFHYGAYTCEACKLFFKRAIKERRKRLFTECKKKQCIICSRTRKSCTECRFKKCIAVGMDLSRSKYGRHTSETQLNDRDHIPNISSSLIGLHEQLIDSFNRFYKENPRKHIDQITRLFDDFYQNTLYLFGIDRLKTIDSNNDDDITFYKNENLLMQITLVTFMQLFGYKCEDVMRPNSIAIMYSNDLSLIINHIREQLYNNEFSTILKIFCFIYSLHMFKSRENDVQDAYKKRLSDLIKSEFALFKYNKSDEMESIANFNAKKSGENCDNRSFLNQTCYFNSFMLSLVEISILANQYFKIQITDK